MDAWRYMSKSYREGKTYNYPMIEEEICFYSSRKELNQMKQKKFDSHADRHYVNQVTFYY